MSIDPNLFNQHNKVLGNPDINYYWKGTLDILKTTLRKRKIRKIYEGSNLKSGFVYAPYVIQTSNPQIIDIHSKNKIRMQKISNIFNLGLNIEIFSPKKSIYSPYSIRIARDIHNSKYYKII